jgi:hypothetical protein
VSGFVSNYYELTLTRARFWHGSQACGCSSLSQIAAVHLGAFTVLSGSGRNFLRVRGPGPQQRDTGLLHESVSGKRSR